MWPRSQLFVVTFAVPSLKAQRFLSAKDCTQAASSNFNPDSCLSLCCLLQLPTFYPPHITWDNMLLVTKYSCNGQFRPKRGHQISDPVVSVSFWSKPLSWTTCDALWPILAFYSHFVDIFGPRVGFWGPRRTKFQNDCWGPFSCILLVCLHLKGCN